MGEFSFIGGVDTKKPKSHLFYQQNESIQG